MEKKHPVIDKADLFKLGDWLVEPSSGTLRRKDEVVHLAPKVMELLLILVRNQGEVVFKEQLMNSVWPDTFVAETALTRSISELRHSLDDNSGKPIYIETIPKRGYRLLVPPEEVGETEARTWIKPVCWGAGTAIAVICLLLVAGYLWLGRSQASRPVLVVLPFEKGETTNDMDILTVGLVENVIDSLSRISGLDLVSGTTLIKYGSNQKDLKKIARQIGVNWILEGSFEPLSEDLLASVKLIDTKDQKVIWNNSYIVKIDSEADVATEITMRVAEALGVDLSSAEILTLTSRISADRQALQYRLMGDYFRRTEMPEFLNRAITYYKQAIELNPSSAEAYSGLAEAYLGQDAWNPTREQAMLAQEAVSKALALNSKIPESHIANGILLHLYSHDYMAAEQAFKEAIRLDPGHANARREYGLLLMRHLGRPEEALYQLQEAARLDPLLERSYYHLFELYLSSGNYELAMENARREYDLNPMHPRANRDIALTYLLLGEIEPAVKWAQRSVELLEISPGTNRTGRYFQLLTILYLYTGRIDKAEETSLRIKAIAPDAPDTFATAGLVELYKEDYRAAAHSFRNGLGINPEELVWSMGIRLSTLLGYSLQASGDSEGAERALQQSIVAAERANSKVYKKNVWPPLIFQDELAVLSIRKEYGLAVEHMADAVHNGWNACQLAASNPVFTELRADPEYQLLCERVKKRLQLMRQEVDERWSGENDSYVSLRGGSALQGLR